MQGFLVLNRISPLLVLLWILRIASVAAFPAFDARIPNGNQVPNPCDRNLFWRGVGHESPEGAGPLNAFGVDFFGANKTWTPLLCRTDSDGDGLTNGEELGDPFCVWRVNATPTVRELAQITHPGICEPLDAPRCFGKNPFLRYCLPSLALPRRSVCENVTTPENAFIVRSSAPQADGSYYSPGDTIQFSCWPGFALVGNAVIKCLDNGAWSSVSPVCRQQYVIPVTLQPTFCPAPPTPRNGFVSNRSPDQIFSQYAVGEIVAYSCLNGYSISNRAPLQCLIDGSWSIAVPTCLPAFQVADRSSYPCSRPRVPNNAMILIQTRPNADSRYMTGSFVMFVCALGYAGAGKATVMCNSDGSWTRSSPFACSPVPAAPKPNVTCDEPTPPLNAYIFASSPRPGSSRYAVGDFVQFGCLDGFESDLRPVTFCQPTGVFAPNVAMNCTRKVRLTTSNYDCAAPPIPFGSNLIQITRANYYLADDVITYTCLPGYATSDPVSFKCLQNGTWASQLPNCTFNSTTAAPPFWTSRICDPPPTPKNGYIVARSVAWKGQYYAPNDWIQYACDDGYVLMAGTSVLYCDREGDWAGTVICRSNAIDRFWYYGRIDEAWTVPPPPGVLETDLQWFVGPASTNCPAPTLPPNTQISPAQYPGYAVGTSVTISCVSGFIPAAATISCRLDGTWSQPNLELCRREGAGNGGVTCIAGTQQQHQSGAGAGGVSSCPAPTLPPNSLISLGQTSWYPVGAVIIVACSPGFAPASAEMFCNGNGTWLPPSLSCTSPVIPFSSSGCTSNNKTMNTSSSSSDATSSSCPTPVLPANTQISSGQSRQYPIGASITISCNQGYSPATAPITCRQDGAWSQPNLKPCQLATVTRVPTAVASSTQPGQLTCCPSPSLPPNMLISMGQMSQYNIGALVIIACKAGFLPASAQMVCQKDATWTQQAANLACQLPARNSSSQDTTSLSTTLPPFQSKC